MLQRHAGPLIDGVVQLTLTGDEDSAEFVIDGRMLSDAYPVGGAGSQTGVRRGRAPQADASITLSLTTFGALARWCGPRDPPTRGGRTGAKKKRHQKPGRNGG